MGLNKKILAMYDVRGIQDFIYRNPKIQDAMGASNIVENIIKDSMESAISNEKYACQLEWVNNNSPIDAENDIKKMESDEYDVLVLYIGGGNAFFLFKDIITYKNITKGMSKYIINNTYSLQLASACVECEGEYDKDMKKLRKEMDKVKALMTSAKPIGALPIIRVDPITGYPMKNSEGPLESELKRSHVSDESIKELDKYVEKKGLDSTLAVVHIDGNNMGLRIKKLMDGKKGYVEAVNQMREISCRISVSYLEVFNEMKEHFEKKAFNANKDKDNVNKKNYIRKILVAGDDITYVCRGNVALQTVKYYGEHISQKCMKESNNENDKKEYGFSVCAGVSYFGSHFPFSIAYDVAEECCEEAKSRAKSSEYKLNDRIGSFVDFQFCKNVQTKDLDKVRSEEYITPDNTKLLKRPYYIPSNVDGELYEKCKGTSLDINSLFEAIEYFNSYDCENGEYNIPKSFCKDLRNTYPLGKIKVNEFVSFLNSRNWQMPDCTDDLYELIDGQQVAKWYDVLDVMEMYFRYRSILH